MTFSKKNFLIFFLFLCAYLSLFIFQKINLTSTDIGRHIKNGELITNSILNNDFTTIKGVLYTNYYSYTNQYFPFINHHWGSGIVAFLIFKISGWSGLSIMYGLVIMLALYFSLKSIKQDIPLWITAPVAIFLVPLVSDRTEIRPEGISYFLIMFFIYYLSKHFRHTEDVETSNYKFWVLPALTLLWANLHIYFIFGLLIIGAFCFESLIRRNFLILKKLILTGIFSTITACINPFGPKLLLYPFMIFRNYGYLVAENQSISFLQKLSFVDPNFLWWHITAFFVGLLILVCLIRKPKDLPIALTAITIAFAVISFTSIRNFTMFGLVSIPLISTLMWVVTKDMLSRMQKDIIVYWSITLSIIIIIFSLIHFSDRLPSKSNWGIGLAPKNLASADFVKTNHVTGPFFTNYDIGGYFIYNMFSKNNQERLFVDNRPEAYPTEFFQNEYTPMQTDKNVWQKENEKYNFNTIWFYRLDMTPWAQAFLIEKVQDPEWVPVFVDDYTIIFVRNNSKNSEIIKNFRLPKEIFGTK